MFGFKDKVFDILPDKNSGYVAVRQYEEEREIEIEVEKKKAKVKIKVKVSRIDEFLGFGDKGEVATNLTKYQIPSNTETDIYIIDDANMDFSSGINKAIWSPLIDNFKKSKAVQSRFDTYL